MNRPSTFALGQVYLDSPSSLDSFLPQFVLQSDVFNKQVKNILIKISDIQTSTTNTLPTTEPHIYQSPYSVHQSHPSIPQQTIFLRKITSQKNLQIESLRRQILESQQIRINDCNLIEELENRIRVFHEEKNEEISQHLVEKQNLLNRINRIEEYIDSINGKDKDQRVYELEMEVEMLRNRMQLDNSNSSFNVSQVNQQIVDLKLLNNNLAAQNGEYKFQLQMLNQTNHQIQMFKSKIIQQQKQLNTLKHIREQHQQYKQKLLLKDNQIVYNINLVSSLNKQLLTIKQSHQQSHYNPLYNQQQIQYLNRQIQQLRRQNQQLTKKQNDTYEEKVKFERECYKLTSNLHQLTFLKQDLETKKFELEISRKEVMRLQGELSGETRGKNQLVFEKEYLEGELRKKEGEKQDIVMRYQNLEKDVMKSKILQTQISTMSTQLSTIHQKYIDSTTKSSQLSLKHQLTLKQNQSLKQSILTLKHQLTTISQHHQHKQQQFSILHQSYTQLTYTHKQLQSQCYRLENELKYNDSKLIKFEETLIEFQRANEELQMQLGEIRHSIIELQQLENIFQGKQQYLTQLVSNKINKLIKYRQNSRYQHSNTNYKLQKRNTLFNQLIQLLQSQSLQITQSRQFVKTIEDSLQKYSFQIEKNKLSINTLMYQKEHLFHQLNSVLEKLKYVENHLERQTRIANVQQQEIEELRGINKGLKEKLGEEMGKRGWLENRMSGGGGAVDVEGMKMERDEVMRRMKGIFEGE